MLPSTIDNRSLEHDLNPSAPAYDSDPSFSYNPNYPNPMVESVQPTINVPPLTYAVPGTLQPNLTTPVALLPPTATILPVPQIPAAPLLHEVTLTEERQKVRCPFCYTVIVTKASFATGTMTHIVAAALIVAVVTCPFFWMAYFIDCCKDVNHGCPQCGRHIGKFRRFT